MARSRREFSQARGAWVITFADLMTLLLALFVLIFSMSSLDSSILMSISAGLQKEKPVEEHGRGEAPQNVRLAAAILAERQQLHEYEGKIKELLFPRELLPPAIDKGTLADSVRIMEVREGIVFILPEEMLFEPGSSRLSPAGLEVVRSLVPLADFLPGPVRISGHARPREGQDAYLASSRHALAVLGVFLNRGFPPSRLSAGAYGAELPRLEQDGTMLPGRVEILLKTGSLTVSK